MLHQFNTSPFRRWNGRHVGTIPTGTIVYIQDNVRPFRFPERVSCREPWQVIAWIPRELPTFRRGEWQAKRCAGGHLAMVRSLRTGRVRKVADWILRACIEAGLEIEAIPYEKATRRHYAKQQLIPEPLALAS